MNQNGINVLSLFDGISGAFVALEKAGIKINNYYSSEIDESCLAVQRHHYSADTRFHQIGDVTKVDGTKFAEVDLVIYGSPCLQLSSINKKDRSGLEGPDSKLFYEAIRIIKEIYIFQDHPKKLYVLAENVASMDRKNRDIITQELQSVFPDIKLLKINSSSLAASNRRRLYWTNIPDVCIPTPIVKNYKDVLVNGYVDRDKANVILSSNVTLLNGLRRYYKMNLGNVVFKNKEFAELPPKEKLESYPLLIAESGYNGKAKRNKDEYAFENGVYRHPSILELERLMTFPDGYISGVQNVSVTEKKKAIGLSFTVSVISHLLNGLK